MKNNAAPLSPEILVPRIGEYLLELGALQAQDLQNALDYQADMAGEGRSILLGQAMLELELITRETLDEAVTMQILRLQSALKDANNNLQQHIEARTRDLQRALEQIAELNHLKSNFLANISHELRTPLMHISGYVDLLADEVLGPLNAHQEEAIVVLRRSSTRLERMIDDLIQFSAVTHNELDINRQPVDLNELIQESMGWVRQSIGEKRINLQIEVDDELPLVSADQDKIGWVLRQFIDNALKFTADDGWLKIAVHKHNKSVDLAVIDSGIGIPKDRIEEIFEPFHQLDSSSTRRFSGTGLGLAMAHRIVKEHGSQIEVESFENKGSRFRFSLPIIEN